MTYEATHKMGHYIVAIELIYFYLTDSGGQIIGHHETGVKTYDTAMYSSLKFSHYYFKCWRIRILLRLSGFKVKYSQRNNT